MTITKVLEQGTLTLSLAGRLDTLMAPKLEAEFEASLEDASKLILDFKDLKYVSSAGLRAILRMYKQLHSAGREMVIRNVLPEVMEVFDITGFVSFLTIE